MRGPYTFEGQAERAEESQSIGRKSLLRLERFPTLLRQHGFPVRGRVLEIGCGFGMRSRIMALQSAQVQVVGLDRSPQLLNEAIRAGLEANLTFTVGDLCELPFEDNSFDFVYARLVFMNLTHPKQALQNIFRVLNRGGRVLLEDYDRDSVFLVPQPADWTSFCQAVLQGQQRAGVDPTIGRRLSSLLAESGFENPVDASELGTGDGKTIEWFADTLMPVVSSYLEPTNQSLGQSTTQQLREIAQDRNSRMYHAWFSVSGMKPHAPLISPREKSVVDAHPQPLPTLDLVSQILIESAKNFGDCIALVAPTAELTYQQLIDRVARLSAGLQKLRLFQQDCVALLLPNGLDLATTLLATAWSGMISAPLAPTFAPPQIQYILRQSGARAIVTTPELLKSIPQEALDQLDAVICTQPTSGTINFEDLLVEPPAAPATYGPMQADPIALLVYTSGTTSRPKGVAHSQSRIVRRVNRFVHDLELTQSDSTLSILSIGRPISMLSQLLAMLRVGGKTKLLPKPNPATFWQDYASFKPTYLVSPPGQTLEFVERPEAAGVRHDQLRFWIVGGDKCPAGLHNQVAQVMGCPLLEMLGMTEVGFYCITPPQGPMKIGSVGQPMSGIVVRLVDEFGQDVPPGTVGRILVGSAELMVGYWNDTLRSHDFLHSGWLDTQDLANRDSDGYIWFVGRNKDMIACGGYKVAPAMVEEAMLQHPAIASAGVAGATDERYGQIPVAFYTLHPAVDDPGEEQLKHWLSARLEPVSVPAHFYRIQQLPTTDAGKIDRARLVWMADAGGIEL